MTPVLCLSLCVRVRVCRQHTVLVNRGWVPPNWKAEWRQHFMQQQPQGLVAVSGVVQGSESPSSYVPQNQPEQGLFFWVDVPGLVSINSSSSASAVSLTRAPRRPGVPKQAQQQGAEHSHLRGLLPCCVLTAVCPVLLLCCPLSVWHHAPTHTYLS